MSLNLFPMPIYTWQCPNIGCKHAINECDQERVPASRNCPRCGWMMEGKPIKRDGPVYPNHERKD